GARASVARPDRTYGITHRGTRGPFERSRRRRTVGSSQRRHLLVENGAMGSGALGRMERDERHARRGRARHDRRRAPRRWTFVEPHGDITRRGPFRSAVTQRRAYRSALDDPTVAILRVPDL